MTMINPVNNIMDNGLPCLPQTRTKYHIIPIIEARITGAVSQTIMVNMTIKDRVQITLIYIGVYFNK